MMAYAEGGSTIVSLLGNDPNQLSWQVQNPKGESHPLLLLHYTLKIMNEGSKLLLTVVDSVGHSGGFNTDFYNVVGTYSCGAVILGGH